VIRNFVLAVLLAISLAGCALEQSIDAAQQKIAKDRQEREFVACLQEAGRTVENCR
jgi:hypothetical protein